MEINTRTTKEYEMTVLDEIRTKLNERETKAISDNKFSQDYLGRSRSYLSVLKHKQMDISNTALLSLYGNLKGASESWKEIAESSPQAATSRSAQNYRFFSELTELVWKELEERVAR